MGTRLHHDVGASSRVALRTGSSARTGLRTVVGALRGLGANLAHRQTNFARMLWKFHSVYNPDRQYAEHNRPVRYQLPLPGRVPVGDRRELYIHTRPATQRIVGARGRRAVLFSQLRTTSSTSCRSGSPCAGSSGGVRTRLRRRV